MQTECSKCGSRNVFTKNEGNPTLKGRVIGKCGDCGHEGTVRTWDYTGGNHSYVLAAVPQQGEPTRRF